MAISSFAYPPARRSDHVDVYQSKAHGQVPIADPYQWLESHSNETEQWVKAQEEFTVAYLDRISDKSRILAEIRNNTNYPKFSAPSLSRDNRWYWYHNSGLRHHSILYRSKDDSLPLFSETTSKDAGGDVFFDPNLLSDDGTAALVDSSMSHDGKYFAYAISMSGSDFCTIYVRSTDEPFAHLHGESQKPTHHDSRLSEEIRFVKFSTIVWSRDSKGFFYQRFPDRSSHGLATEDKAGTETTGDANAMLCYHRLGTPQSEDIVVHKDDENPTWMWSVEVSELDGRYLALYSSKDTSRKNKLWIADLNETEISSNMKWQKVVDEFEAEYDIIANDGPLLYVKTNENAPMYNVITIDLTDPNYQRKILIPEDKNAHLSRIRAVNQDKFFVAYKRDVKDEIYIYDLSTGTQLERLSPNFIGAATLSGRRDRSRFFATLTGFDTPGTVMMYDSQSKDAKWSQYRATEVSGIIPTDFESRQVWYESKDGTKVPMFVVRHKDTPFDGTAPAIQYGYGGFNISVDPFFSPAILTVMQKYGAILAVPNIRGGSEFGEEWHLAGTRDRKVNCFDDFIAATEFLVKEKYAAKGKVAINGGSNGGLLVAACLNRAPEGTFGVGVAEVGVLDLLKFADFTIGRAWCSDYGDPHVAEDFDFLYPISPLHNVPKNKILPPTLLMTADHDDRVVPLHSFKHAATLQYTLPNNPHPLLLRVDTKAGHGAGKSTEKRIADAADKWSFVVHELGLRWKD